MKCVEFQNEFEEQNSLSEAAETHLFHCKDCQKFEADQNRVWEMLGGLGQVEAPKDFNFRVKARIAEAKPADFKGETIFFPALRFVLPLGFVVVLLSFVALSGLYFVDTQDQNPIATQQTPTPIEQITKQSETVPADDRVAQDSDMTKAPVQENNSVVASEQQAQRPNKDTVAKNEGEIGGSTDSNEGTPKVIKIPNGESNSIDSTAEGAKEVLTPKGFDKNQKRKLRSVNSTESKPIDEKEILKLSGIETVSEKGNLKVVSVRKNSVAERSQVKNGDIIEAINGEKITGEPLQGKTIDVNSITVLRGGDRILIKLKAN